ncbi:uncharacterized protein METZ01_LOCUS343545, partial [marine metagenome]
MTWKNWNLADVYAMTSDILLLGRQCYQ